jgi:hypothetical protein
MHDGWWVNGFLELLSDSTEASPPPNLFDSLPPHLVHHPFICDTTPVSQFRSQAGFFSYCDASFPFLMHTSHVAEDLHLVELLCNIFFCGNVHVLNSITGFLSPKDNCWILVMHSLLFLWNHNHQFMIACTSLPNNRIRLQIYVKTYAQSIEFWNGPLGQGLFLETAVNFRPEATRAGRVETYGTISWEISHILPRNLANISWIVCILANSRKGTHSRGPTLKLWWAYGTVRVRTFSWVC